MSIPIEAERQNGFALLIVLWSLGLLALLVTGLAVSARSGVGLAENVRDGAVAEAAADGSVQQAMFQLRRGAWQPNEPTHRLAIGQAVVEVLIEDQSERINPNLSSPAMLADGTRFRRRAVVRLSAQPKPDEVPWQVVTWN